MNRYGFARIMGACCALSAVVISLCASALADGPKAPYARLPAPGDSVRLDGSLGGGSTAWAYADRAWLEQYLDITISAAQTRESYAAASEPLSRVATHVTAVPNGTPATVETVQPYSYDGRLDVEVRVLVQTGPLKGRELWTTCGELVDNAGHRYLSM
jgi:hypothetical protein